MSIERTSDALTIYQRETRHPQLEPDFIENKVQFQIEFHLNPDELSDLIIKEFALLLLKNLWLVTTCVMISSTMSVNAGAFFASCVMVTKLGNIFLGKKVTLALSLIGIANGFMIASLANRLSKR
jgi:hypothetical protein